MCSLYWDRIGCFGRNFCADGCSAVQAVDELGVESHEEVSHSDEDVPEVSLLGSNTSLDIYVCAVKIQADRYHGEMSFQLERR